jgi:hypothetical protein
MELLGRALDSISETVSRSVPGSPFATSRLRAVTTTVAPAKAKRCAIARPMPRLAIASGGPADVDHRIPQPEDLLGGAGNERQVALQLRVLIGMPDELVDQPREGIPRRLHAADDEIDEEQAELAIRRSMAAALGLEHLHLRIHLDEGYAWGLPKAIAAHSQAGARSFLEGVGALERVIERGVEQGIFRAKSVRRCARTLVMMTQIHLAAWIEDGERASARDVFDDYWADVSSFLGIEGSQP